MHNELIYNPNTIDRDRWEQSMFQVSNPPPKLSGWQEYFVRIKQGEDLFPEFLHHYEPVLNSIARQHITKYGLNDHFADVKMVYVETLLAELEHYDPTSGETYLTSMKRKLEAALHAYTMVNLKGFSETSQTYYYQLRKAACICHDEPEEKIVSEVCTQLNITEKTAMPSVTKVILNENQHCQGDKATMLVLFVKCMCFISPSLPSRHIAVFLLMSHKHITGILDR